MKSTTFSLSVLTLAMASSFAMAGPTPGTFANLPLTAQDTAGIPTLAGSASKLTDAIDSYSGAIDKDQHRLGECESQRGNDTSAVARAVYLECSLSVLEEEIAASGAFRQAVELFGKEVMILTKQVGEARGKVAQQQAKRKDDEATARKALEAVGRRIGELRAKQASKGLTHEDKKEIARLMFDDKATRERIERHNRAGQDKAGDIAKLDKIAAFYVSLADTAELNAYDLKGREETLADVRRDIAESAEAKGVLVQFEGVSASAAALTEALQKATSGGIDPSRYTGDDSDTADVMPDVVASSIPDDEAINSFLNGWTPPSSTH